MSTEPIAHLRNTLATFVVARAATATRDLVAAFVHDHSDVVDKAAANLRQIALTKLVDEVSRRRQRGEHEGRRDLFHGFSLPRAVMVDLPEGGRGRSLPLETAYPLLDAYLARKPKTRRKTRDTGLHDAMERARPYLTSAEMTLGEGLAAADAADLAAAGRDGAAIAGGL